MAIRKKGYVAMLDVLGFSERVMRDPEVDGLDAYIDTVAARIDGHSGLGTILFSDTVVLYTFDDRPDDLKHVLRVTSCLMYSLLMANVPVRGAISHGRFSRTEQHGVVAGRPIIDAHHYESQLQWIGVMLTPSVVEHVPDIELQTSFARAQSVAPASRFAAAAIALQLQKYDSIPLESSPGHSEPFEGYAVVPLSPTAASLVALLESLEEIRLKLEHLKQRAPNSRSQIKYRNSLEWLETVKTNFVVSLSDQLQEEKMRGPRDDGAH
jgi:hypothetical protein